MQGIKKKITASHRPRQGFVEGGRQTCLPVGHYLSECRNDADNNEVPHDVTGSKINDKRSSRYIKSTIQNP